MSEHRDEYKRTDGGNFAKGNKGGPGNPYARSVAKLKTRMLEVIDEDKLEAYILRLFEMAMEGDHQAGKMLLSYVLGKPEKARDPDQIDVEEWNLLKQEALIVEEMPYLLNKPDPEFPLGMVRAARPVMAETMAEQLHDKFQEERELERQEQEIKERRRQQREAKKKAKATAPSPNGEKRSEAPLPNRDIGAEAPLPNGAKRSEAPLPNGGNPELVTAEDEGNRMASPLPNRVFAEASPSPNGKMEVAAPSPNGVFAEAAPENDSPSDPARRLPFGQGERGS